MDVFKGIKMNYMKCAECGEETQPGKFCSNCGTPLKPAVEVGISPEVLEKIINAFEDKIKGLDPQQVKDREQQVRIVINIIENVASGDIKRGNFTEIVDSVINRSSIGSSSYSSESTGEIDEKLKRRVELEEEIRLWEAEEKMRKIEEKRKEISEKKKKNRAAEIQKRIQEKKDDEEKKERYYSIAKYTHQEEVEIGRRHFIVDMITWGTIIGLTIWFSSGTSNLFNSPFEKIMSAFVIAVFIGGVVWFVGLLIVEIIEP